jgi:alpha-glucosidase
MKKTLAIILFALFTLINVQASVFYGVESPDKKIYVQVDLDLVEGIPFYSVSKNGKRIIEQSKLGFEIVGEYPDLSSNLQIINTKANSFNETWEQVWGEDRFVENNYNELIVTFQEKDNLQRKFNVVFRVFNDGFGFRYEFPEQENLDYFIITDEKTEFKIAGNTTAWWVPSHAENSYGESLYRNTPISGIAKDKAFATHTDGYNANVVFKNNAEIDRNSYGAAVWSEKVLPITIATPVTFDMNDGTFLAIHEANLTDFASMTLTPTEDNILKSELVPWASGLKVYAKTPFVTPWRTVIIADKAGDLIASRLMFNLNEPCKIEDTSWIKPMKYVGIWWGMHINKYTWYMGPKHGATTENTIAYMDFAAKNGFGGVLTEGWNVGWDNHKHDHDGNWFSFVRPYADFDIEKITEYGHSKGVQLIGHHETYGAVINYENQMIDGYELFKKHGMHSLKSGYVKQHFDRVEWHDGQYGVRHYRHALEEAAKYQLALDVHEPIKQTGISRTYPNLMTQEGARGQEFNAWDNGGGNPPYHTTILPFTRILAGPMDYTPGVFNFDIPHPAARVQSTIANQLALYVVLYSPLQMACDLPENYEKNPKPFQFIKDVPTDWQETKVLNAELGKYVTITRKDRNSENWYIGSITNEEARELTVSLDFLTPGAKYTAQIYADGAKADYKTNPTDCVIKEVNVNSKSVLKLKLAAAGGQAVRIVKK